MKPIYSLPPVFRGPSADVLPLADEANWGMSKFQVEALRKFTEGSGIKVGIVDTGVDDSHPLLSGVKAKDFTGSSRGYKDANGHGTHTTGTVGGRDPRIGVGPKIELYHGKGLSDSGSGGMNQLLSAMEWCLSEGCSILSCSWGGGTSVDPTTDRKFREWSDAGAWLVFAAGNSGGGTPQTDAPGNSLHAINIAALSSDLTPAVFSSAGTKIDSSGPGVDIWSTKPGGGFQRMSGTSMATPWCAGLLALYRAELVRLNKPVPKTAELREILKSDSMDVGTPGIDRRTGPGAMWALLLANNLIDAPPPVVG